MKVAAGELAEQYASALQAYLSGGDEASLHRAYELGRRALSENRRMIEIVALYNEALLAVLRRNRGIDETHRIITLAQTFFLESLSPFEMAHRQFQEAIAALGRVNEALEEEAKRIAHALHDQSGQLLASVHIALDELSRDLPGSTRERLKHIKNLLGEIELQLRRLSHELRPTILDDLGLVPALEFLAEGVSKRTGIQIRVEGSTEERLSPMIETALYRIAQEALSNIAKHAEATRVFIRIQHKNQIIDCSIQDDGVGFDVSAVVLKGGQRGLGLVGIRERLAAVGGTVRIISKPGEGTVLFITVPTETKDANSVDSRR